MYQISNMANFLMSNYIFKKKKKEKKLYQVKSFVNSNQQIQSLTFAWAWSEEIRKTRHQCSRGIRKPFLHPLKRGVRPYFPRWPTCHLSFFCTIFCDVISAEQERENEWFFRSKETKRERSLNRMEKKNEKKEGERARRKKYATIWMERTMFSNVFDRVSSSSLGYCTIVGTFR